MEKIKQENLPKAIRQEIIKKEVHEYASSLKNMIVRVNKEPKLNMIYSGIKEKSVGVVFGPSKSGKTIFCEGLGLSIAAGADKYLGLPLNAQNRRVLFISLEEYYRNRTERNIKQVEKMFATHGDEWLENYIVVNDEIPRYINTEDDWMELVQLICNVKPGLVFIDSLTHLYQGSIEDSKVAIELTKNLRNLQDATDTTIVGIHHTHKMYGQRLSIDTIAGSRVIAQETDFMIGLNRTPDGQKYIKDVAFRYAASNDDTVRTFEIGDNCWLNITGETDENKILSALDGRKDDANKNMILEFLSQEMEAGKMTTPLSLIIEKFVTKDDIMTRTTVFNNLNKLLDEKVIAKFGKGAYSIAA